MSDTLAGAAGLTTAAGDGRAGFAAAFADFRTGAAELDDLRGAAFFAARVTGRFTAVFFADFFAAFFAGAFLATLRATFRAAVFATFFAAFAAVLRRAAGRFVFAAFRVVFRLRVVGLIIVSGSSARMRAGAISVTRRGFMRANRFEHGFTRLAYIAHAAPSRRRAASMNATSSRVNGGASIVGIRGIDGVRTMKNELHPSADLTRLGELIEGIEVAMLTTHAADGSMVCRPLQTLQFDASGDLVFFTAADSRKLDELAGNPDVNLAYANPKKQVYVSVRGTARTDRDRATIDALWSPVQKVFFPEGRNDPNLVVLRVRVRDAAYWESAGNFIARALDFARGMVSDEPRDLGKSGKLAGNG